MNADTLLAFVRYHAWANDRILTTAAGLSDDQLHAAATLDHGSAFQTIRHLIDVDWSWQEFCTGHNVGNTYIWNHGFSPTSSTTGRSTAASWPATSRNAATPPETSTSWTRFS